MQANTPWEMLPSRQRTRSAPRNSTRFAAQYSARGLPCERFTAVLTDRTSCITRGRGGWLDLPRGGLAPPIPCQLSWRAQLRVKRWHVLFTHDRVGLAALSFFPRGAQRPVLRSLLHHGWMSTLDLFMRRFAGETFDPKRRGKEAIWARWKSRLETDFFGEGELMVRKPRAPAMSKEAMRQESERLVREAMARNVTITQGKTRLAVKCRNCVRRRPGIGLA